MALSIIDWFVPVAPTWLPSVAVFFGLQLLLIWYFDDIIVSQEFDYLTDQERKVTVGLLVVGYLFVSTAVIRRYASVPVLSLYLFFLAQTIEGAATLRFFARVRSYIQTSGSATSGKVVSWLRPHLRHWLLVLFTCLVATSFAIYVLTQGPVVSGQVYDLSLIYTITSFTLSTLGIQHRLKNTPDVLNRTARIGLILCLVGGGIFDYNSLGGELLAYGIGLIGYTFGFWLAAIGIMSGTASPTVASIRRLIRTTLS